MTNPSQWHAKAEAWKNIDPDPDTRAEIDALLAAGDDEGLRSRFITSLRFGTAGLRGELGAGPNRMNRVVVRQAAQGLVDTLDHGCTVVIGFDARHKSDVFAADTAQIVAASGRRAIVLPRPLPTPVLAFAIRHLDAAAGVMVTASHNPPRDNGYKVYLADGAQIIPPHDTLIEAAIDAAGLPPLDLGPPTAGGVIETADESLLGSYLDAVLADRTPSEAMAKLRVVYTPLHGVGRDTLVAAMARLGCEIDVVAEQGDPDPDFPTVNFPNPEEPGALDLAIARARVLDADVVLANDPDADRLCVAIRRGPNDYAVLSGDDLGVLLGDYRLSSTGGDHRLLVTTVVSSSMLSKMAAAEDVRFEETLTGFKWVIRPSIENPDLHLLLGYEEALGYAVTTAVRDKDGISAAAAALEAVAALGVNGQTALERLDELARTYGHHHRASDSVRFVGDKPLDAMSERMRTLRADLPTEIGEVGVARVVDYSTGHGDLAPTDLVRLVLVDGSRVQFRPSGTEPKLKIYVETVSAPGATSDSGALAARLLASSVALITAE